MNTNTNKILIEDNNNRLIFSSLGLFNYCAAIENNQVTDIYIESKIHNLSTRNNIYLGTVKRIEPSLKAAFVDIGLSRYGFLSLKVCNTTNNVQVGQKILVQVKKEPNKAKGVSLTTSISLSGRLIILMLRKNKTVFSSALMPKDKKRLEKWSNQINIPQNCSLLFRTGANLASSIDDIKRELDVLTRIKDHILSIDHQSKLIYKSDSFASRILKNWQISDYYEIVAGNKDIATDVKDTCQLFYPDIENKISLDTEHNLADQYGVIDLIRSMTSKTVYLKSGSSIVIETTEALTSIDVNSSRYKGKNIEETAYNINLEVCSVIAQEIRRRGICGLIVIDFIDMDSEEHRIQVQNTLMRFLKNDRAKIRMTTISSLGLVQISRQHLYGSVKEILTVPCPHCAGTGTIKSPEIISEEIIHDIRKRLAKKSKRMLVVYASASVQFILNNLYKQHITAIEKQYECSIYICTNSMTSSFYELKTYDSLIETEPLVPYNHMKPLEVSPIDNLGNFVRNIWKSLTSFEHVTNYQSQTRLRVDNIGNDEIDLSIDDRSVIDDSQVIETPKLQRSVDHTKSSYERVIDKDRFSSSKS